MIPEDTMEINYYAEGLKGAEFFDEKQFQDQVSKVTTRINELKTQRGL